MKRLLPLLLVLIVLQACNVTRRKSVVNRYPSKVVGIQQLVLAVQDENVTITDTIKSKKWWSPIKGKAVVTVMVPVTYKYFVDFKQDYSMRFSGRSGEETLHFRVSEVEIQEPIIHKAQAVVQKKGIFINEQKEINRILANLPQTLQNRKRQKPDQEVQEKCEEELRNFLMNYCKESGVPVKEVKIKFDNSFFM